MDQFFLFPLAAFLGRQARPCSPSPQLTDHGDSSRIGSLGATALLLAALLIYQPPAMFFWVLLAVAMSEPAMSREGRTA